MSKKIHSFLWYVMNQEKSSCLFNNGLILIASKDCHIEIKGHRKLLAHYSVTIIFFKEGFSKRLSIGHEYLSSLMNKSLERINDRQSININNFPQFKDFKQRYQLIEEILNQQSINKRTKFYTFKSDNETTYALEICNNKEHKIMNLIECKMNILKNGKVDNFSIFLSLENAYKVRALKFFLAPIKKQNPQISLPEDEFEEFLYKSDSPLIKSFILDNLLPLKSEIKKKKI